MLPSGSMQRGGRVIYEVPKSRADWELSEETMPESVWHDEAVALLKAILAWWATSQDSVQVARNLAVRWDSARPKVGLDPDVSVLHPRPPDGENLASLRTWLPGHLAPKLAIEVVSESNPNKDYAQAPDKYAASGTEELWIFDPQLAGPRAQGGPVRLQIWRRAEGSFVREYAGEGPAWSSALGAWAVVTEGGRLLRIASAADGSGASPTDAEAQRKETETQRAEAEARRAEAEARRAEAEAQRVAKEAALAAKEALAAEADALRAQLRAAQAELAKRSG